MGRWYGAYELLPAECYQCSWIIASAPTYPNSYHTILPEVLQSVRSTHRTRPQPQFFFYLASLRIVLFLISGAVQPCRLTIYTAHTANSDEGPAPDIHPQTNGSFVPLKSLPPCAHLRQCTTQTIQAFNLSPLLHAFHRIPLVQIPLSPGFLFAGGLPAPSEYSTRCPERKLYLSKKGASGAGREASFME